MRIPLLKIRHGDPYTGKTASLFWDDPLLTIIVAIANGQSHNHFIYHIFLVLKRCLFKVGTKLHITVTQRCISNGVLKFIHHRSSQEHFIAIWTTVLTNMYMMLLTPLGHNELKEQYLSLGSAFSKSDQIHPWIRDQLGKAQLFTVVSIQLQLFVLRGKLLHMTQNFITVEAKL